MLFEQLTSQVIKQGLISKMQFSLGYRMIGAVLKAATPPPLSIETGEFDYSAQTKAKETKKAFAEFQEYCQTYSFQVDPLDSIIDSYIKGSTKPVTTVDAATLARRAAISGKSTSALQTQADAARLVEQAKKQEAIDKLAAEFKDLTIYANGYYNYDDLEEEHISDIIQDSWVVENYPKVVKSQTAFWAKYNNWNDTEVLLIELDQQLLDKSGV